jgi:hypothetical protein
MGELDPVSAHFASFCLTRMPLLRYGEPGGKISEQEVI